MLFFNPGKKIAGIPLIGNKLDLYDESAHELYDYKLDYVEYHGQLVYMFEVKPKEDLGFFSKNNVVVDQMTTWFNPKTLLLTLLMKTYRDNFCISLRFSNFAP